MSVWEFVTYIIFLQARLGSTSRSTAPGRQTYQYLDIFFSKCSNFWSIRLSWLLFLSLQKNPLHQPYFCTWAPVSKLLCWLDKYTKRFHRKAVIFYLSVPLTQVEDVKLEFLLELDLDVTNDEERHREVDVDPPVIPPDLVDLRQVWSNAGLLNLELKQEGFMKNNSNPKRIRIFAVHVNNPK